MIKHIFRGVFSPAIHSNGILTNVFGARFARKAKRSAYPRDDERELAEAIRMIEATERKAEKRIANQERRKGIVQEEKEEDLEPNEGGQEFNPFSSVDTPVEVVYDEELKGYFRKDAIDKLKADPDFMALIKQVHEQADVDELEEDSKELKKKKRKQKKVEEQKENLDNFDDEDDLDEFLEGKNDNESEPLEINAKDEQIAHIEKEKPRKEKKREGKLKQKGEQPSLTLPQSEAEDALFQELDEFRDKPEKEVENRKDQTKQVLNLNERVKKAEKANLYTHNEFVVKLDPKVLQRVKKIIKHDEKQKESNKKQDVPALYIDFKNTREVSTFVNDQSIDLFSRTLKKLSPSSFTKLLSDTNFIDKDPAKNSLKMLLMITHMRRNALLKNYDRPDIREHVQKMIENLPALSPEIVTMLVHNLDKMRINEPEYFRKLETFIIAHAAQFDLRGLSNIVYSFANTSLRQSIVSDFSQLYKSLEIPISLRLKEKQPKDLTQIMTGYSKTQNFSNEFLQVMEKACIDVREELSTQELAVILHCFWKNDYRPERLLEFASKEFFSLILLIWHI